MKAPSATNSEYLINKKRMFELDRGEDWEKQLESSNVPFADFILMTIIKTKSRSDKIKADSRIKSPTIKKIPRVSSSQEGEKETIPTKESGCIL